MRLARLCFVGLLALVAWGWATGTLRDTWDLVRGTGERGIDLAADAGERAVPGAALDGIRTERDRIDRYPVGGR